MSNRYRGRRFCHSPGLFNYTNFRGLGYSTVCHPTLEQPKGPKPYKVKLLQNITLRAATVVKFSHGQGGGQFEPSLQSKLDRLDRLMAGPFRP
jgi:hypothetical protein